MQIKTRGHSSAIEETEPADADLPSVVVHHCQTRGLLPQLHAAISLAKKIYKPASTISGRIQIDPDTDEQRIILDVPVDGDLDDVLAREDEFGKQWARTSPVDDQQIRVLYYFI